MKTILVTGGAGFIGSHLCRYLLNKNNYVVCADNFYTSSPNNIKDLKQNPNFELLRHDITWPLIVEVDQIYNLACPASPIHYQRDPVQTIKTSVLGIINMLGIAKRLKIPILQASTSEVYGDPKQHPQKESYWGNVNPIGVRSCFSEDTEVLTDKGWKFFKDVKENDKIATLNKNNQLEYQKPIEIIKQEYHGELIEFKNYHCDLLVTPNHKMYVKKRSDGGIENFQVLSAFEAINWNRAKMLKVAKYENRDKEWFYFPKDIDRKNSKIKLIEKIKMDDWLEFFGYFVTEGCVSIRKRSKKVNNKKYIAYDYRILIAQSKKNKKNYNKIKYCLEKLPFNFVDSYDHQFCITNKQLANYLKRFGKSYEKYVPRELLNTSKRQLLILFNAMMLGDGNAKGTTYFSNSYKLISNFQELLLKIGYAGNIAIHDKRKKRHIYQIHVLNRFNSKYKTPTYSDRSIKNYNGLVYCVNVPNHIIFVRRNGKALFCGNCYDEGKRAAETLMMDYHRQNKVDIKIVRIFNTYGPNMCMNDGRVVSNFIVQALKNENITVYGDGSQTRSFCYVADLVEGLYLMMNSKNFIGPVNMGNPNEKTILELAKKIIELTGSRSRIIFKQLPKDDPVKRKPDISLAKQKLGWEPKVELEEGLKHTINYFKKLV
jgi:UDP-glucuronate decarboxylase